MNIKGKKVTLRAIEESDLEQLHKWANDPGIWHLLGGWHFPSSMEFQKKWFSDLQRDHLNQRFAVDAPDLGLIGTTNLTWIDWKNNHAFTGVMLGKEDALGKGYGVDTMMAIMRYAFEELHLERLDSAVIEYNVPSLNLFCKRCGWKEEGRKARWFFRSGRYWDRIIIGITRGVYEALIAENKYWETP